MPPAPPAPPPRPSFRLRVAQQIVDWEARRDARGRLKVYRLPAADGGGTYEVAGVNDRYHPEEARHLKTLIETGKHELAEEAACHTIADYTDIVERWLPDPCSGPVSAFLRDCCWNRGPKGALRILQLSVGVADDGKFGPVTRAAVAEALEKPQSLIHRLRYFREQYERRIAPPVGERAKFWPGLVARWDAAERYALSLVP